MSEIEKLQGEIDDNRLRGLSAQIWLGHLREAANGSSVNDRARAIAFLGLYPEAEIVDLQDHIFVLMAKGQGEALTTYAVVLGVAPEDRAHFAAVTHEHFQQIFSKADVTAEDVHTNTLAVLKSDPRLAKYATQA